MSTVLFCWTCQLPVSPRCAVFARHYEDGRRLAFCCAEHLESYKELESL